jgi:hypothetical protein
MGDQTNGVRFLANIFHFSAAAREVGDKNSFVSTITYLLFLDVEQPEREAIQ